MCTGFLVALAFFLGACDQCPSIQRRRASAGPDGLAIADAVADAGDGRVEASQPPAGAAGALDVVFVVERAPSAIALQGALGASMQSFVQALRSAGFGSLRFSVITTDMGAHSAADQRLPSTSCTQLGGDRGKPILGPSCAPVPVSDGRVEINGSDDDQAGVSALRCLIDAGGGCVASQPLWSIHQFAGATAPDALRTDAHLLLLVISDQDDRSIPTGRCLRVLRPTAAQGTSPIFRCAQRGHYCKGMDLVADTYSAPLLECRHTLNPDLLSLRMVHERVSKLRSAPHGVFVAVMAGWPVDPSAATYRLSRGGPGQTLQLDPMSTGAAVPALRLQYFADLFGAHGTLESVCADAFTPALSRIAERAAAALPNAAP